MLSHVRLFGELMDYTSLGFSFHGISQARILVWAAISFSRGASWPRDQTRVSWKSPVFQADSFTAKPHYSMQNPLVACGMWDLGPWLGSKPGPPALEVMTLSPWTTREILFWKSFQRTSSFVNDCSATWQLFYCFFSIHGYD